MRTWRRGNVNGGKLFERPQSPSLPTNSALIKKCEELAHGLAREQRKHVAILEREIDELEH